MSISYKSFLEHPQDVICDYRVFFFNTFPSVFKQFYPETTPDGMMILSATRRSSRYESPYLTECLPDATEQYYFAASVFFVCLIPQVICRVAGTKAKESFHKASGWPVMSAGLGGLVSPVQWLLESEISPEEGEAKYFNALLDIVMPFHRDEILAFIEGDQRSLNPTAYKSFCEALKAKKCLLEKELLNAAQLAKQEFLSGNISVYYLTAKELYGQD